MTDCQQTGKHMFMPLRLRTGTFYKCVVCNFIRSLYDWKRLGDAV